MVESFLRHRGSEVGLKARSHYARRRASTQRASTRVNARQRASTRVDAVVTYDNCMLIICNHASMPQKKDGRGTRQLAVIFKMAG